MLLMVLPPNPSAMIAASAESGMDRNTATVPRMLPRNSSTIKAVSRSPDAPSWISVLMAFLTYSDWSNTRSVTSCFGMSTSFDITCRTPSTTAMVLVLPPCFMMGRNTDRWPSTRTMLV